MSALPGRRAAQRALGAAGRGRRARPPPEELAAARCDPWRGAPPGRACSSSARPPDVQLSARRYEALLDAEIMHFARAKLHPIPLRDILGQKDVAAFREFLLEELPIRYARRLHLLESMPQWKDFPHLKVIRSLYADAFRRLRDISLSGEERFRTTLEYIRRKNSNMLPHVVRGTRAMKKSLQLDDERVNDFLDDFLTGTIGTDILSSQYLAMTRPGNPTSVIDPQCDPVNVVRAAAEEAKRLCMHHYGRAPPVEVVDIGQVRFPFISGYLNYIMLELLKNSLRAVTERHVDRARVGEHPVRVVVCGDERIVVVRVSDCGGGIPPESLPKVWSYLYTTATAQGEDALSDGDSDEEPPMAGFGCGLPLSRNYATYAGGSLALNTMYGYGTDAYLYLNRLGDSQEVVEVEPRAALPCRGFVPRADPVR